VDTPDKGGRAMNGWQDILPQLLHDEIPKGWIERKELARQCNIGDTTLRRRLNKMVAEGVMELRYFQITRNGIGHRVAAYRKIAGLTKKGKPSKKV